MPDIFNAPVVIAILQFGAGYLLKRYPNIPNQIIPVANYLLALFAYQIVPSPANAGFLGDLWGATNPFVLALLQTIVTTGLHSINKNTVVPLVLSTAAKVYTKKAE